MKSNVKEIENKCKGGKKGKAKARDSKDYDTMLLAYIEKEFMNDKK